MKERKATREIAQRYQRARKKEKSKILDKFTALIGYNRAYASYLLGNHGKTVRIGQETIIKVNANLKAKRQRESPLHLGGAG